MSASILGPDLVAAHRDRESHDEESRAVYIEMRRRDQASTGPQRAGAQLISCRIVQLHRRRSFWIQMEKRYFVRTITTLSP